MRSSLVKATPHLTSRWEKTHIVHMKRIGIRKLHLKTGEWVRSAALGEGVATTDRGRPVASLLPVRPGDLSAPFRQRLTLRVFDALPSVSGYSGLYVSEDRE